MKHLLLSLLFAAALLGQTASKIEPEKKPGSAGAAMLAQPEPLAAPEKLAIVLAVNKVLTIKQNIGYCLSHLDQWNAQLSEAQRALVDQKKAHEDKGVSGWVLSHQGEWIRRSGQPVEVKTAK